MGDETGEEKTERFGKVTEIHPRSQEKMCVGLVAHEVYISVNTIHLFLPGEFYWSPWWMNSKIVKGLILERLKIMISYKYKTNTSYFLFNSLINEKVIKDIKTGPKNTLITRYI